MSNQYTHQVLKVVVAQVCETIGWNSITASSLELMVDVLDRYLQEICKTTHNYTELYNRTEANLDDLGLAFRELGINLSELEEYIQYVDPIVPVVDCPKLPIKKESHLNFLKPGSKEVLTRPMHIHEHLPPINPTEEEETITNNGSNDKEVDVVGVNDDSTVFKRPSDGSVSDQNGNKKQKLAFEEEGRPTREIQSVMMTTSGFISPAREGKLPESKPPNLPPEFKPAPPPPPPAKPSSPLRSNKFPPMGSLDKKFEKKIKKKEKDKEKKKERIPKPDAPIPLGPLSIAPPQQAIHHQVPQSSPHLHQSQPSMMSSPSILHMRDNPHIVPQQISPQMPGMTHMSPAMNEKLLHKKMMAMTKKQEMKIPKLLKKHKLKEPKLDNTFPPFMKPERKKNPVGRPPKNPLLPSKYMQQKMNALAASQGLPSSSFMSGNQSLHPNPMAFSNPQSIEMSHQQQQQQPTLHSPQQPLVDGKLMTEPDRNKLNIFKKIQGKNKDDLSHKSLNITAPTPIDFSTPQKIERPELDIFRTGPQSSLSPQFDVMGKIPKKLKQPRSIPPHEEMPINMSLTKNISESQFTYDDLALPKTPNFPRTPEMKMEKKKKRKEKEKKMKGNDWPMSTFFNDNAGPSNINNPFLQKVPENPAALLAGTGLTQAQQNLLFPFGNLSNLGNLFPSGPGLIPNSSLFPPFTPLGSNPFGLNPPMGMPGSDLKFPKQSKKSEKKEFGNILPEKSFCNVAPLVPPSLTIEPSPPKQSTPRFDLPLGAEKLPAATQITPIKSYDKNFESMKPQSTTITSMSSSSHKMEIKPVEPVTTYDLTSSPEPVMPAKVKTPQPQHVPTTQTISPQIMANSESKQLVLPPPISTVPHSNPQLSIDGDVVKIKDKSEKKKDKEHKKDKKDKDGKVKKKKDKKDKSKNREGKEERKEKKEKRDKEGKEKSKKDKKEKRREKERASSIPDSQSQSANDTDTGDNNSTCSVPKLTFKLMNSPRPNTPDVYKKISKVKKDDYDFSSPSSSHTFGSLDVNLKIDEQGEQMMHGKDREVSPELAKIAPLITRPPKQKPSKRKDDDRSPRVSGTETDESPTKEGKPAKLRPPIPEIGNSSQANPINPSFKPSSSSELVSSPTKHSKTKYGAMGENIRDADGNEVWICPSCGCPDDGTPMIGCDGCDAWYHWVCVGIQVPPDANEDWYCRVCLSKKQGDEKKKKKRKKDKIKDH